MSQERRKRKQHLRVPVFPEEKEAIEFHAKSAGMSVAKYLREIGQSYRLHSIVDYEKVADLAKINADLGRLGGLLKWWLTDDERTAHFGEQTILALLDRIENTRLILENVSMRIVRPRSDT